MLEYWRYMRAKGVHLKALRHLAFALFVIRSAFGDTNILILAIFVFYEFKHSITIDSVWLGTIKLTEEYFLILIGIHAFSGNDYISSYFWEAKKNYWKITEKFPQFRTCLKMWGISHERHGDLFEQLEDLVCFVSGAKVKKFFSSFQAGPSVSCQPSKLECICQICGGHSVQPIITIPDYGWLPNDKILSMDEVSPVNINKK